MIVIVTKQVPPLNGFKGMLTLVSITMFLWNIPDKQYTISSIVNISHINRIISNNSVIICVLCVSVHKHFRVMGLRRNRGKFMNTIFTPLI